MRYLFVGQLFEQRPTYRLLGFLLFLQLGISATGSAAQQALAGLGLISQSQQLRGHLQQESLRSAVVLQVCHSSTVEPAPAGSEGRSGLVPKVLLVCSGLDIQPSKVS